jgi:hypothetical protein
MVTPPSVCRISGSLPRLPTKITRFILAMFFGLRDENIFSTICKYN